MKAWEPLHVVVLRHVVDQLRRVDFTTPEGIRYCESIREPLAGIAWRIHEARRTGGSA